MRKRAALVTTAAVAVVVAAVGLPLFQPWRLVTDRTVDEALPISTTTSSKPPPTVFEGEEKEAPKSAAPKPSAPVQTPVQKEKGGAGVLLRGELISHEHETSGRVAVLRLADGRRVLRFEGLATSDGPDLRVWLSDARVLEGRKGWHVFDDGRYKSLGKLKGNRGNQNYVIPESVRLEDFRSVAIWCDRFNVSFGAATLA
ncbi:DM13 domain-containing protein [Kribbella sandramycini]|uniref:DM13 domain-containing protein n=1 Tax=Kribbella sandramycini TaxID=60450 RepID=A0A7Y4NY80_9ACTN|nr:DM13 domain-containing protein [Kribbella sandramycini]MBB6568557.1 hypothetical protein [Kribbella sandramycini]NOL38855.1 DM13 domain-containing protein [Kribbella sandramycini]